MDDKLRSEEYRREWAMEVLKLITRKQGHLVETLHLTKEIGECLDRNDRVSVDMLLQMRGAELEGIKEMTEDMQYFRSQLPQDVRNEMDNLLDGKDVHEPNEEMKRIAMTCNNCKKLLNEIIQRDKIMSRRIAGSDSFYK